MENETDINTAEKALSKAKEEQLEKIISGAITKMFEAEDAEGHNRFVNVSRVPLICQAIIGINKRLEGIESNINWGVKIVIGAVILGLITLLVS